MSKVKQWFIARRVPLAIAGVLAVVLPAIAASIHGVAARALPASTATGEQRQARTSPYGDLYFLPIGGPNYGPTDEGGYFKALSPTPGTGIAMGIQTTFSDTANVLAVLRNMAAAGGKRVFLDYIKLTNTVAGATTTASHVAIAIDDGDRWSAGGTLLSIANANMASTTSPSLVIRFGAVTATAASGNRRVVSHSLLKLQAAPCWTVGDTVLLQFASGDHFGTGTIDGAAAKFLPHQMGPAEIEGGQSLVVHMWNVANATTPPSWEVEIGWWER
jgi:hypothetical protein